MPSLLKEMLRQKSFWQDDDDVNPGQKIMYYFILGMDVFSKL